MQVKSEISRGLTRTIAEAAESWQGHHGDVRAVRDVDYLVREALRVYQFLQEWRDDLWQTALANEIPDLDAAGRILRRALERALEAFQLVRSCVHEAGRFGHQAVQAAELEQAVTAVGGLKEDLIKRWPWVRWELLEPALEAHERGETIPLEELFDELRPRVQ
jgi:hypothetical protein